MSETYYGSFYGFESPPFHITPDPSLLFATQTHQQASGAIEYGIASGKGFIVVTGEVGVGKTTVLKMCLDKLIDSSKTKIIYIFNPALSVPELYATILEELDVSLDASMNPAGVLRRLLRALLATHKAGIEVILAVDEAQNMPEQTLEGLRILSNLETAKSKLLQIILVGQPELEVMLAKHSLRQLAQRVAVRARIQPLSWRQSCRYIQHRSQCSGRTGGRPLFTAPALWYLAVTSRGIPRTINISCDNALINGYGHAAKRISLAVAYESCQALHFRSSFRHAAVIATAVLVTVCIALFGSALFRRILVPPSQGQTLEFGGREEAHKAEASRSAIAAATQNGAVAPPAQPAEAASVSAAARPVAASPSAVGARVNASLAPSTVLMRIAAARASAAVQSQAPARSASRAGGSAANSHHDPQLAWRWIVRRGDSVYKLCRATYGECDDQTLRMVFARNPQIGSNAIIKRGMVIVMPERNTPVGSN